MKIEKNKIVFAGVLLCIFLFIGSYYVINFGKEEEGAVDTNQIPVPELNDEQKEYNSKLEALDDLKEVRQTNSPSIYDEQLLDSTGVYDPDLLDKEKMRVIDSIYAHGRITYSEKQYKNISVNSETKETPKVVIKESVEEIDRQIIGNASKEKALEHELFFASDPSKDNSQLITNTDAKIYVRVDGTQTVKENYRLQMRLLQDARINNKIVAKNTLIYGFVSFRPNRTSISIEHINHEPVKLKAHDLQDGSEGIYIENSFRAEATNQVIGDLVDDINITGVPQVSGIKNIFRRNHINVKVTVNDGYTLILKPKRKLSSFPTTILKQIDPKTLLK